LSSDGLNPANIGQRLLASARGRSRSVGSTSLTVLAQPRRPGLNVKLGFPPISVRLETTSDIEERIARKVTGAIIANGLRSRVRRIAYCARLKCNLFRDAERIINLDPEITHGALQLRVAKQRLHYSQFAGLLVYFAALFGAKSACRMASYRARRAPPFDGPMRAYCRVDKCRFPRKRLGNKYRPLRASRAASRSQRNASENSPDWLKPPACAPYRPREVPRPQPRRRLAYRSIKEVRFASITKRSARASRCS
jgi:hypothetical protein